MRIKILMLHLLSLMIFSSCFDSGSDESGGGGGLFSGHKKVEDGFSLNVPNAKTYNTGENLDFVATHPSLQTVTGTPRIQLDIGGDIVYANYLTGSGTKNLTFRYTVQAGDLDSNGIEYANSIDPNGGQLRFIDKGVIIDSNLNLLETPSTASVLVDTQGPTLTGVTPPPVDTYYVGQQLQFLAVFDDVVEVSGTPQLTVNLNSGDVIANYASGSGSTMIFFNYTVTSSDLDGDGIAYSSPLDLNGGTITDSTGNAASLSFTPLPAPTTFVDGDSPIVSSITYPANNTYFLGDMISFDLQFNEVVNVAGGIPSVEIDINGTMVDATYLSGTGTDTLRFQYIVAQDLYDANGITIQNTIALNGATIQDAGGANAKETFSPSLTPLVLVDSRVPSITAVTAPANNNYTTGMAMDFNFQFDEAVAITNTPRVQLTFATGTVYAEYLSGAGTDVLTFRYVVQAADVDNDGVLFTGSTLELNGATIESVNTGNDADLSFATLEPNMTQVKVNESLVTQLVITTQPTNTYQSQNINPAITVELRDATNNLVVAATDNVTLAFGTDPSAGAATLGGTLTVSAIGGIATFSDINIDVIQSGYTLTASSGVLTPETSLPFDITQAPATQLAIITQPTDALAGDTITPAVTVELQDALGNVVTTETSNVTLAFGTDPSSGNATLGGTVTVAAVSGIATFSDITLDKAFTGYTLTATAGGLTAANSTSFNISAAAKSQLAFTVEPSNTNQDVNIAPAIQVEIQDSFGNRTTDTDSITLAINNNAGPGGTLAGTATVAAVNGIATFSDINIDIAGSGYTLDATAGGLTTATSVGFNIIAVPTQLVITQEPTDTNEGIAISPAITVEIRDAANNLVTTATDNVSVAIGTNPSAGTLSGSATVAAVGGVATFSDLNIDNEGTGYTLAFTSGALTGATSAAFNINKVPTQIIITQEPTNTDRGVVIAPAITVELRDASNTLVTSATNTVTVAIGTDPSAGSAVLGGTTSVAAVGGVATFNNLTLDTIASGYTLIFSSGALTTDTSTAFNITQPPSTQLAFVQQPTNAEFNTNISPSITVEFRDASNQIVSNETSNVTLSFGTDPSSGTAVLGGTLTVAAVNGVATFSDIQIDTANTGYTLVASSGALTPDTSSSFDITPGSTVAITTAPAINNANAATYGTSGTCSEEGVTVTITIAGTLTDTPTCTGGAWSSTIDVSSLLDGPTISIQADHDTASDSTTVVKDTTAAVISSVTTANTGNLLTGNVLTYTVTFNEPVDVTTGLGVDVVIGTNTRSAVCGTATASTTVTCNYTIAGGDTDEDGMVTNSPLTQGAATVTDAYGNTTSFFNFTPPDTSGIFANASSNIVWRDSGGTEVPGGAETWGTNENPPSATRVYQVYNSGGAATTGLTVQGQGANKFFQIIANTCGAVLPAGSFCEVTIEHFECKGGCNSGATNGRTFRANDGSNVNLDLTGYEAP